MGYVFFGWWHYLKRIIFTPLPHKGHFQNMKFMALSCQSHGAVCASLAPSQSCPQMQSIRTLATSWEAFQQKLTVHCVSISVRTAALTPQWRSAALWPVCGSCTTSELVPQTVNNSLWIFLKSPVIDTYPHRLALLSLEKANNNSGVHEVRSLHAGSCCCGCSVLPAGTVESTNESKNCPCGTAMKDMSSDSDKSCRLHPSRGTACKGSSACIQNCFLNLSQQPAIVWGTSGASTDVNSHAQSSALAQQTPFVCSTSGPGTISSTARSSEIDISSSRGSSTTSLVGVTSAIKSQPSSR